VENCFKVSGDTPEISIPTHDFMINRLSAVRMQLAICPKYPLIWKTESWKAAAFSG
jgi:hypothetical protein